MIAVLSHLTVKTCVLLLECTFLLASLLLQLAERRNGQLQIENEDTNTSDNSAGEEMSFKPDHFLFLWCQNA